MKTQMINYSAMTPMERQYGRVMRAPDHPGGNDSGGGSDNQGGNGASQNNESQGGDNPGNGFDAAAFWNEPGSGQENSPGSPGSAESNGSGPGTQQNKEDQNPGQTFAQRLADMTFGATPVVNEAIMQELGEGKLDGLNNAFTQHGRAVAKQVTTLIVELMQAHGASQEAKFQQLIEGKLGSRDDKDLLSKEFPSYADPAIRPMIQGVFNQSMKHSKGDRTKAIELTRDMLKFLGKNASADLGIEIPAQGPGDTMTAGSKSLVDQLLERNG